ncbi:MAG: protein NrnU, partial [Candidatus Accumulibacter sp.]|nr:protein NrnU [Accumulibacter sp.]
MAYSVLIAGLLVFLAAHSVRIVADEWRTRTIARIGAQAWKGAFSLLSIAGFLLIVWGFSLARSEPVPLWSPPPALRHLASLLILPAF